MLFVIPQFARVFEDMRMTVPLQTQVLLGASELGWLFWLPVSLLPLTLLLPIVKSRTLAWARRADDAALARVVQWGPPLGHAALVIVMLISIAWIVYALFLPRIGTIRPG
ncbi:MAG: hypothetical protein HYY93_09795 [Planctomycetes bacterium]|nr:hypothetical protein [Planctomycetota bacterium]